MRAALWMCTFAALPAVVRAQTPLNDAYHAGDRAFGLWAGASLSSAAVFGKVTDRRLMLTGLRMEYVLESDGAVTTTYTFDVHPLAVVTNTPEYGVRPVRMRNGITLMESVETGRAPVVGAGVSPIGLQFYTVPFGPARLFAGGSAGGIWFGREMPVQHARRFNFALQLGAGAELTSRSGGVLVVGYKFSHLSNANTADMNPGLDGHLFYVGLLRRRVRHGELARAEGVEDQQRGRGCRTTCAISPPTHKGTHPLACLFSETGDVSPNGSDRQPATLETRTMKRSFLWMLVSTAALAGVACSDSVTNPSASASLLDAFVPALAGFNQAQSSFSDGTDGGMYGGPLGGPGGGGGNHRGHDGFGLMGGGLGGGFIGAGFGAGFGHRPYDDGGIVTQCVFSSSSGRIACDPITRNGLTITRSVAYTDASGAVQSAFDESTTNTINTQLAVSGTVVGRFGRRRGHHHNDDADSDAGVTLTGAVTSDTTTVQYASNRTVGGLADASTQRTVTGTSAGQESTVGTDSIGRFTLTRVAGDTATGVVIPIQTTGRSYPTAGTIVRSMKVTLARDGASPVSSARRELVTYDGSATATVVITQDGTSQTCSLPLPRGRLACQ